MAVCASEWREGFPAREWLTLPEQAEGGDDPADPLLNSAHALVGAFGANKGMATAFVDWLVRADGGQRVIEEFTVNGHVLYSGAAKKEEEGRTL